MLSLEKCVNQIERCEWRGQYAEEICKIRNESMWVSAQYVLDQEGNCQLHRTKTKILEQAIITVSLNNHTIFILCVPSASMWRKGSKLHRCSSPVPDVDQQSICDSAKIWQLPTIR